MFGITFIQFLVVGDYTRGKFIYTTGMKFYCHNLFNSMYHKINSIKPQCKFKPYYDEYIVTCTYILI